MEIVVDEEALEAEEVVIVVDAEDSREVVAEVSSYSPLSLALAEIKFLEVLSLNSSIASIAHI